MNENTYHSYHILLKILAVLGILGLCGFKCIEIHILLFGLRVFNTFSVVRFFAQRVQFCLQDVDM